MTEAYKRVTDQQVALFRHCFTGLPSVYGTYDPITGGAWQVKAPVTDQVIRNHLMGLCPFGVYLLVYDRTHAIVVDFDTLDPEPPQRFVLNAARRGLPAYIERSKSKGHHVWLFADAGGILAANGRRTASAILEEMGLERVEVFPRQDCLHHGGFGNFINTPLFGRLTATGHSVFVDPENALLPFPDQWAFLANIQRIREDQLDTGMPICAATTAAVPQQQVFQEPLGAEPPINPRAYALPPCARKMLLRGVSDGQRVICFRLGIHLKRFGIPRDLAVIMLQAWARKNHPVGKRILTDSEIVSQVTYAYRKPYWGYGCRDPFVRKYCHSACPVLRQMEAISAPVPRNA